MKEILKFEKVGKTFYSQTQETVALRDLSFAVDEGEFVAVLGPSGCGKSTILSLICGLLQPSCGKIETVGGKNKVGYMLQRDHLFEWRTVWQNITLGLEVRREKTAENLRYANDLAEKYGLKEFLSHRPAQLSGGMRQRVALIRTLTLKPQLLLLDEPFSALDFQTRLAVTDDVYSIIKSEKKTAVLVTHDIGEAISMADRVLVLTARPATVKAICRTDMTALPTKRREDPDFSRQFEKLHALLGGVN